MRVEAHRLTRSAIAIGLNIAQCTLKERAFEGVRLTVHPLASCFVACILLAASRLASADAAWMIEEAMRADIIGETLQGYYDDGRQWTASYARSGR